MSRPRVVLLRGYSANPWDLQPWRLLAERYDISVLVPGANEFEAAAIGLPVVPVRATRDLLPGGRPMRALAYVVGDRYQGLREQLAGADIVHSADLGTWFSAQAAGLRAELGFRLVLTAWETIPFLSAYRWPRERRWRSQALAETDLFLAASERAREGLVLEGVSPDRIAVSHPGIDTAHFAAAGSGPAVEPDLVLSPGRLVWEKGHQDVLRALAALRRGIVPGAPGTRLLLVGSGPDEAKLRRYAAELGIADAVEWRVGVPYAEMPQLYARAGAMVLASLPARGWEEQFGMVLAEAMAAGVPVIASQSGAIPEVAGPTARLFAAGDWMGIARQIAAQAAEPPSRAVRDPERVARYSSRAASERIAAAYDRLLGP